MVIIFNIENQTINCIKNYCPAADSREYLKAKFIFTPDWDGCVKTAIFSGTEKAYEVLLTGDECTVPHEVLGGRFGVSVFGINGDMRITTDTAYITVHQSGFAEGETPSDPTPTVYEQLLTKDAETEKQLAEHEAGFNHPDGCVTTEKIADYAVTQAKVAPKAINELRLAEGAVTREKLGAELAAEINAKADKTALEAKADKTALKDTLNRYDVSALPSKSQTYDFSDGVSKFIAVERMDVTVESETQVMMSAANAGNKYGLAQFDFGSITDGATRIIAEYDTKYC